MYPWNTTQFPSSDEFGIPTLDLNLQAQSIPHPVVNWNNVKRSNAFTGTYAFYCDDFRFRKLITTSPHQLVETQCQVAVEPNPTTTAYMPRAQVLYDIFRKRWLARYWQTFGIRILVDLNVCQLFAQENLRGVPKGWSAYCTRSHRGSLHTLEDEYALAIAHAGTDSILFAVYGGGNAVANLCQIHHWIWLPDQRYLTLQARKEARHEQAA